jgi:malate/lactate dehydrogenase
MSSLVQLWIPQARVFGLGCSVDCARISYIASRELGKKIPPNTLLVGGEHGHNLVPISSLWRVEQSIRTEIRHHLREWAKVANDLSIRIVSDLGYTLQDCAVAFSRDIAWLSAKLPEQEFAVFSAWNEIANIGVPVSLGSDLTTRNKMDQVTESEREQISIAESEVHDMVSRLRQISST